MAFSTRRFVKHIDKYDITHRIEIQEDGFGGTASSIRTTGRVFRFEHETHTGSDEELLNVYENPVQKGSIELHLLIQDSTDRTLIDDIFNGDEDDFRLVWKIDGSIYWTGTVLNDMLEYPESDFPYSANLWAKDFSHLKGVDYSLTDSRQTLITTFANLLNNLGYGLDIETHTSWINENTTDSVDFLQQIYHETKALRDFGRTGDETDQPIGAIDALEMLCRNFGCVVRQEGGVFKIIQYSEYETPSDVNVTVYDSTGTEKTAATSTDLALDASTNDITITDRSITKAFKAIRRAQTKFDHRTEISGVEFPDLVELEDGQTTGNDFQQLFIGDGSQYFNLSFDVYCETDLDQDTMEGRVNVSIDNYELQDDDTFSTDSNLWYEVDLTFRKPFPGGGGTWSGSVSIDRVPIPNGADGVMTIEFAGVAGDTDFADFTRYSAISMSIENPVASENSTSINYELTQSGSYSTTLTMADTWFGDGPTPYSVSALRFGSGDGDVTADDWQRRGSISYRNFHENLLKEVIDLQRSNRIRTDGQSVGADYDAGKIISYRSKNLAYTGGSFVGEEGDWHPVLFEINIETGSDTFDDILKFTDESGSGSGSTSSGGGGGGIDQSTADNRYFRQSQAFDELATADIDTALTNLGLKGGSADLAFSTLGIGTTSLTRTLDVSGEMYLESAETGTSSIFQLAGEGVTLEANAKGSVAIGTDDTSWYGKRRHLAVKGEDNVSSIIVGVGGNPDAEGNHVATYAAVHPPNIDAGNEGQIAEVQMETEGTTANNRGGRIMLKTKEDGGTSDPQTRAIVTENGRFGLGIGENKPARTFHMEGDAYFESSLTGQDSFFRLRGNSGNQSVIDFLGGGKIGINKESGISSTLDIGGTLNVDNVSTFGANMLTSSNTNIRNDNFSSGWLAQGGEGYAIFQDGSATDQWNAEFNNLLIRGRLKVFELIVKQIATLGGTEILSVAVAEADSVSGSAGSETVSITDPRGFGGTSLADNDLVIVQRVDLNDTTVVKQEFRTVNGAPSGTDVTFTSTSGAPAPSDPIEPGDIIVAYGNTTNTDRQNMMYRSVEGELVSRFQSGVDSYADFNSPGATSNLIMGDLDDAQDLSDGTTPTGFGFYAKGNAFFDGHMVAQTGKIIDYITIGDDTYIGNDITRFFDPNTFLLGNLSDGADPGMRITGSTTNDFVQIRSRSGSGHFFRIRQGGSDIVDVTDTSAKFFGAFVDQSDMWAGAASKSNADIQLSFGNGWITSRDGTRSMIFDDAAIRHSPLNTSSDALWLGYSPDFTELDGDALGLVIADIDGNQNFRSAITHREIGLRNEAGDRWVLNAHYQDGVTIGTVGTFDVNATTNLNGFVNVESGAFVDSDMIVRGGQGGRFVLPNYSDASRPSSPNDGELIYNTTTNTVQYWNGAWVSV